MPRNSSQSASPARKPDSDSTLPSLPVVPQISKPRPRNRQYDYKATADLLSRLIDSPDTPVFLRRHLRKLCVELYPVAGFKLPRSLPPEYRNDLPALLKSAVANSLECDIRFLGWIETKRKARAA